MDKTLLGILLLPCGAVELNNMFGEFFFVRRTEIIDHSRFQTGSILRNRMLKFN